MPGRWGKVVKIDGVPYRQIHAGTGLDPDAIVQLEQVRASSPVGSEGPELLDSLPDGTPLTLEKPEQATTEELIEQLPPSLAEKFISFLRSRL